MATMSRKRRDLVQALSDVVHGTGNFLVSPPGSENMRMEVVVPSTLPEALIDAGHTLVAHGHGERIEPIVTTQTIIDPKTKVTTKVQHGGFVKTEIWEICLGVDRGK
jgi:hypothetical protein